MDKKLMLAVAGAGKTTYIINKICAEYKKVLIITYTDANYNNIISRLRERNDGIIPEGISVFKYFTFLYRFCYKPFLSDYVGARGINYESNKNRYAKSTNWDYYLDSSDRLYSNRISLLLDKTDAIKDVQNRIKKYFDCVVFDEVQDISGRDFSFLEEVMKIDMNMFYVGDFYQHTYNTSADGNVNTSLFDNLIKYVERFQKAGITYDDKTLIKSWRCGEPVCKYVREQLGINICSNKGEQGGVEFVDSGDKINEIWLNPEIVKLHYQKASIFGSGHRNWGDTKGEDCYQDVCVLLNKTTMQAYKKGNLQNLAASTRNKLYVALTRAKGRVYLVEEDYAKKLEV